MKKRKKEPENIEQIEKKKWRTIGTFFYRTVAWFIVFFFYIWIVIIVVTVILLVKSKCGIAVN